MHEKHRMKWHLIKSQVLVSYYWTRSAIIVSTFASETDGIRYFLGAWNVAICSGNDYKPWE